MYYTKGMIQLITVMDKDGKQYGLKNSIIVQRTDGEIMLVNQNDPLYPAIFKLFEYEKSEKKEKAFEEWEDRHCKEEDSDFLEISDLPDFDKYSNIAEDEELPFLD